MKFAKYLDAESVPEWRRAYIDYKRLKKALKVIVAAHAARDRDSFDVCVVHAAPDAQHAALLPVPLVTAPTTTTNGTSVPANHLAVPSIPSPRATSTSIELRRSSLDAARSLLDVPWPMRLSRRPSAQSSQSRAEVGRASTSSHAMSRTRSRYEGVTDDVDLMNDIYVDVDHELAQRLMYRGQPERDFFAQLDRELDKIEQFYAEREARVKMRHDELKRQLMLLQRHRLIDKEKKQQAKAKERAAEHSEEDEHEVSTDLAAKQAKKRLRRALMEFYRGVLILQNYQTLNKTGFAKILKKFEKVAHMHAAALYMRKVNASHFATSFELHHIKQSLEQLYADHFEGGSRLRAVRALRLPTTVYRDLHKHVLRFGLCIGLGLPVLAQGVVAGFDKVGRVPAMPHLLQVFGALLLPTLFFALFAVNMYVWKTYHVNFRFIFEFDPRDHLEVYEFIELPGLAFLLYSYLVYAALVHDVLPTWMPLIFVGIVLLGLFLPIKTFYYSSRTWFLRELWKNLRAGFVPVAFADFFIADEFTSMVYFFQVMQLLVCAYIYAWDDLDARCDYRLWWITPLVGMVPFYWRLMQCFKRYHDSKMAFPHLVNGGKYLSAIAVLWLATATRITDAWSFRSAFLAMNVISTLYKLFWDLYMDWGLFERGAAAPLLRQELIYPAKWYYVSIATNVVIRFEWLFFASPSFAYAMDGRVLAFILAVLEIYRRFQWNFFRMENEHVNNCGLFRATKDIPLPYAMNDDDDDKELDSRSVRSFEGGKTEVL